MTWNDEKTSKSKPGCHVRVSYDGGDAEKQIETFDDGHAQNEW